MREEIDIDQLMADTWLTVTMLRYGASVPDGKSLYKTCCAQVESVREALKQAGYDDASIEHISYAQCALLDETVMSRKPALREDGELRYEKITWTYKDGNIIHSDSWNERTTA